MQEDSNTMANTTIAALSHAKSLIPSALEKAHATTGFASRWKSITSKLEQVLPCLSDLSSHPCFSKNALCLELLQSITITLSESIKLAENCSKTCEVGKLQMQSDLDVLSGKLDLNLRDCALLMKTGALSESTPIIASSNIRELLTRLQIGHADSKHKAAEELLEQIKEDDKSVFTVLGRTNISAIIQLLTSASPKTKEKVAHIVCYLVESGSFENLLISEGVLPALVKLAESGTAAAREKAAVSLQRLSLSSDTARSIAGHGGVRPLIEICRAGDSLSQSAAAGTLKNLSAIPEVRQILYEEGIVKVMINLLEFGTVLESKEHAAECFQNLTVSNENLRRCVVSEGGIRSLLRYLKGALPQEPGVIALRNLVGSVSAENLLTLGLIPCLHHVLKEGSIEAQQAAASIICKISCSMEVKRLVGEVGCLPLLIKLLEAKSNVAREVAVQTIACLMSCPQTCREVKKVEKSVPNLVSLLDSSAQNTCKKHAVCCLLMMSSSKKCRKAMVSHGAVGYLKKLSESDVPGAKKLVERLEKGKLRSLFSRK